jgi:hypothetical protein
MSQSLPEEHQQRLEWVVRTVELVPAAPPSESAAVREGLAGEVTLRLAMRQDGTLELRARPPYPLPEGLELQRDTTQGPQLHAHNPALARRLWANDEVRRRLEALCDAAPQARISEGALLVELPAELKEEPLRAVLRAALRATTALSASSEELSLAAERKRELVRRTAVPGQLEGGRRFIKLLPEERPQETPPLAELLEERLIFEVHRMFRHGASETEALVHIRQTLPGYFESRRLLQRASRTSSAMQARKLLTLLATVLYGSAVMSTLINSHLGLKLFGAVPRVLFIGSTVGVTYLVWWGTGKLLARRAAQKQITGR